MRILAISAHYPPYHSGGYQIRIKNILDELQRRGYDICILTNIPRNMNTKKVECQDYPIIRRLHDRFRAKFFPLEVLYDLVDTKLLEKTIINFKPDLLYIGHTYILSKALLPWIAKQKYTIVYDEGGAGLIEAYSDHGRWFRFIGDYKSSQAIINIIKPFTIKLLCMVGKGRIQQSWSWPDSLNVIFNSELNKNNATNKKIPIKNATVIHSGVDIDVFNFKFRNKINSPLQIVTPGRIERRKGQLDAIRLLKQLLSNGIDGELTIVGPRWVDGYFDEVYKEIQNLELGEKVKLLSMISSEKLVEEYHRADFCFFPSFFMTGFSRVPLEAMASGCIVISYGFEGSDEIIQNNQTGFIVEASNFDQIISTIKKLTSEEDLVRKISTSAREEIEAKYSMHRYVDQIESVIMYSVNSTQRT